MPDRPTHAVPEFVRAAPRIRGVSLAILGTLFVLSVSACSDASSISRGFNENVGVVVASGGGTGNGRVVSQVGTVPASFEIDCQITAATATGTCSDSFFDAGGGGHFPLVAIPDAGSEFTAWTGCDAATGVSLRCDLSFASTVSEVNFDVMARFDLEVENSCPNITVPERANLAVTSGPRPGPATPVPNDAAAWTGTNYLVNGDFEQPVFSGGIPTTTGYWAFDEAWSAPTGQQLITAQSGSRMLHFVSSSPAGTLSAVGTASEQIQLVNVSALRTLIDAGQVEVEARTFFNRVAAGGCTRIDNAFGIRVSAHAGIPTDVNVDLGFAQGNVTADDNPAGWQAGSAVLTLPLGTTHVAVRVFINEGAANNDPAYPEFHGHYADDSSLTLRLKL